MTRLKNDKLQSDILLTAGGGLCECVTARDLVVLGNQDAGASRFEWNFFHCPKDVCLHREGELQTQIADVVVQDPLQVLGVLWVDGCHVLIVDRDTWETSKTTWPTPESQCPWITKPTRHPPTQDVLVEGAGEVDVDQLSVVESQAQDLTSKPEVVQVVWVHRGVAVGLESGPCKRHRQLYLAPEGLSLRRYDGKRRAKVRNHQLTG